MINNINSNLPNVSDVIIDWFQPISFEYITRELKDNGNGADFIEVDPVLINTQGVVQPTSNKDLKIMPEGSWAWEYLTIHCLPDVILKLNNYVIYEGKKYKIMSSKDWSKYGYRKYIILEAFRADGVEQ